MDRAVPVGVVHGEVSLAFTKRPGGELGVGAVQADATVACGDSAVFRTDADVVDHALEVVAVCACAVTPNDQVLAGESCIVAVVGAEVSRRNFCLRGVK